MLAQKFAAAEKILVINLLYLGDLIFSLPLLAEIKKQRPDIKLDLVANSNFAALAAQADFIDQVFAYDKNFSLSQSLHFARERKQKNYPVSLNIHGSWRSVILQYLCGGDFRAGYHRGGQQIFLHHSKKWDPKERHMVEFYLDWTGELGLTRPEEPTLPALSINQQAEKKIRQKLADGLAFQSAPAISKEFWVINTGGSWPSKRWPEEKFVALTEKILEATDKAVVFSGSQADFDRNETILAEVNAGSFEQYETRLWNAAGSTTIPELIALLRQAELMISGDSGPVHVAALVDTPTLTLFGPSDEVKYHPYHKKGQIIKNARLNCRPCGEHNCPLESHNCLEKLSVAQVWQEIVTLGVL